MTSSPAVGTVRLRNMLPSMHGSSSSPTTPSSGTANFFSSASISHSVGRLSLEIEHDLRMTERGMLRQHAGEFGVAARVLVLLRLPHRRVGVFRRSRRDAFLGEHLAGLGGERLHRLALSLRSGVEPQPQPAAMTDRQRAGAADADMQRGVGAHRVADHMRLARS